jgi:ADP-ribosylglycohydrolase
MATKGGGIMIGAMIGDVIGSSYEKSGMKDPDFPMFAKKRTRFTDDSILTAATAEVLMNPDLNYADTYAHFAQSFPGRGWGKRFWEWSCSSDKKPYESWGNGAAMRVSPIGWWCKDLEELEREVEKSASVTHNNDEAIKAAMAVAYGVQMSVRRLNKATIRNFIEQRYGYDLHRNINYDIRPEYKFDVSAAGSVPEAIICFLESRSFEEAVRNAVSLGGDADTQASIAGALAEGMYGIPSYLVMKASAWLPGSLKATSCVFMETVRKRHGDWSWR